MSHAAMLIIGTGSSKADDAADTAAWHQQNRLWLSNHEVALPVGTPVVARMAGPSNELLIDGIVAGEWAPSRFNDWEWEFELPVLWSRHVIRGVLARNVLPHKGLRRHSCVDLTRKEWGAVQSARLGF